MGKFYGGDQQLRDRRDCPRGERCSVGPASQAAAVVVAFGLVDRTRLGGLVAFRTGVGTCVDVG